MTTSRQILLSTINARYAHSALGLRYLLANLGDLRSQAAMLEFDLTWRAEDIVEKILASGPRIVGLGVYIWNATASAMVVGQLKRLRPELIVVLGGPEASHEVDQQEICRQADYVICGEGDLAFAELCRQILSGRRPAERIISPPEPDMAALQLPYELYSDGDIAQRVIYVEASRGCPFKCEFCLSSLDVPVRNVPLEAFLAAMQRLLERGARRFKFVDRTFNLNIETSTAILRFFCQRYQPEMFLHFEMMPDRLPEQLRDLLKRFGAGAVQLEVGVQTLNGQVARRISRRQNNDRLAENLRFLHQETGVHVHADLIVGLPGEDLDSLAAGFDRLLAMGVQEIQLGILKRLRGAPIARHDSQWRMIYSPAPPYEVLQTGAIDFATMQRLRRMARYWDTIGNSGNFLSCAKLIWLDQSPFWNFLKLSDWLYRQLGRDQAIALSSLAAAMFTFLVQEQKREPGTVARAMWQDHIRCGRREVPEFLRPWLGQIRPPRNGPPAPRTRQEKHLRSKA